jgi:acetyl esterase/lipase
MRAAYIFALALGVAGAGACGSPESRDDVSYDDRFSETKMDVYLPDGGGLHPGVMFVHGGAWAHGSKSEYTQAAKRLASSGWVTASIDYRLVPEGTYPHAVQDCLCALSFLRKHAAEYRLDPARLAVMGYSAGGHLVSLMGVAAEAKEHQPDCASGGTFAPKAVVSGAGWHEFRGFGGNGALRDFVGVDESADPLRWTSVSPMARVGRNKPPFLFVNGDADWFVHVSQARRMRELLVADGNDATILEVSGGGHLLQSSTDEGHVVLEESDLTNEAWIAIIDFLERTVGRP